jgi:cyclic pyranopterin phosphate synthase
MVTRPTNTPAIVDRHGRVINYLRLSITDLCNLRCFYCMPDGVTNKLPHDQVMRHEENLEVVRAAASLGINKVRITGGEPLVKRGVVGLVFSISSIRGIETVAMTTNGVRLLEMAEPLRAAGLQRINLSLDSIDPRIYEEITRGSELHRVIDGMDRAVSLGFPIKINAVLLRGINTDNLFEFVAFAREHEVGLRFIERMGFDRKEPLFSQDEAIEQLSRDHSMEPVDSSPEHPHVRRYLCDGVKIGFISPMTHSFCASCNKLRLQPDGRLRVCLASEQSVNIREILRREHTDEDVRDAVRKAIQMKPAAAPWNAPSEMWKVGG